MKSEKENFIKILSSTKPEEIADLILQNSKIKPLKNVVERIKGVKNIK